MKLYDVMKKWATNPDERFYCYQTDEIWRLEGNGMKNEEDETRAVNEYTLNFDFEEIKEPIHFYEVLERVSTSKDGIKLTMIEKERNIKLENTTLSTIFNILGDKYFSNTQADILLKSDWYVED